MTEIISNFYADDTYSIGDELVNEPVVPTHSSFEPLNDLVLVKRVQEDNSKKGSFIVPEQFREKSNRGSILSIGDKVTSKVSAGDIITFGIMNAETLVKDGEELLLIRQGDIRGVERSL